MANDEINEYVPTATTIDAKAYFDVDQYISPGVWESQKVKPVTMAALFNTFGILGISDSEGVYTYYTTIELANVAASSGDTITFFCNIEETTSKEFILKNGVNYDLNGYTYENSATGTHDAVTDNGVAAVCSLFNGTIIRSGGTAASVTNNLALDISHAGTAVTNHGVNYINSTGTAARMSAGIMYNGNFQGTTTAAVYNAGGELSNAYSYSSGDTGIYCTSGRLTKCIGVSDGTHGIDVTGSGIVLNCVGSSTVFFGIQIDTTGTAEGCTGYSTADEGIRAYTSINSCNGYSIAGEGIGIIEDAYNCTGYSTANVGGTINVSGMAYNCSFIAIAADAVLLQGSLFNCTCICEWNNASGDAVYCSGAEEIFNCTLEIVHASAYCINGAVDSVMFGSNIFNCPAAPVNLTNITQTQTNAPDAYGNIKIG